MSRILRGGRIFFAFLPFILAFLRDRRRFFLLGRPAVRSPEDHDRRAARLASAIASLGPTFIKLAQLLSSRADLVPDPYLAAIGTLQDRVPPFPGSVARQVIEDEVGRSLDSLFERFDEVPIAAASLGQVHRAWVDGRPLVLKVLRPGVEEMVALDVDLSFRVLFWMNVLFPNHRVQGITNAVREFSVRVREEMDFRSEARNIERAREHFEGVKGVDVPRVLEEFTTRRVLVMEYHEGTKIDQLRPRFASGDLRFDEVMERITGVYLKMMMVDGFLHADPHPGNLLVTPEGNLVILDWGIALEVPRWTRKTVLEIALAIEEEDLDGMINGLYRLGMASPEVSRGEIREAGMEIMQTLERARSSTREKMQEIVQEIWDIFYTWPLLLPRELVYFFRAAVLLEGIGFRYDPNFNGLVLLRRVVRTQQQDLFRKAVRDPLTAARDTMEEAVHLLRSIRELLQRTEREELRVRVHPRDAQAQERFLHLQARRFLLSVFAASIALISAILYVAIRNPWLLLVGLFVAVFMFVLTLVIPTHLLENPLRHARGIRPR